MKLKQDDEVFVVYQRPHGQVDQRTATVKIVRVGDKYGYIMWHGSEAPFDLKTGFSHHKEWNTRANGCGFDVYPNREAWEQECSEKGEYSRLCTRLLDGSGHRLIRMTPKQVADIHAILDRKEEDER